MLKIIKRLDAIFERKSCPMNVAAPLPVSATTHRVGRFYSGRPSWRTGLRVLRRRLGARALPLSDEERLLGAARALRREWCAGRGGQEPVRALRFVRPLPLVFLAADGRTTFRYGQAPKNASSSVLYMLLQITGEIAYYPWDEGKHFWNIQRVWRKHAPAQCIRTMGEQKTGEAASLVINEEQIRLHQYAPMPFYLQQVHPLPDIRFCLVRDPVERFVSACQHLIFARSRKARRKEDKHSRASGAAAQTQNQKPMPDIDGFIAAIEAEKAAHKTGNQHFRSQKWFLGCPEYYTHVFAVRQLKEIRSFLAELTQKSLALPNINRTRRKREMLAAHPDTRDLGFTMPPLTAQQKRRIETLYAEDYQAFGRYF